MPKIDSIKKTLVLGSGPIIIGQAAEFDYSGTQACEALKEEGVEVVLINSNPATIMTDKEVAHKIYIEPLTLEAIEKVIEKERPDSLLAGMGGQTALNLAVELSDAGILDKYGVKVIGTSIESIKKGEDRDEFREMMRSINQPVIESDIVTNLEDGIIYAEKIGYPVIIRPAYTLGGTGGGIAENKEELIEILTHGLQLSPVTQVLIEKSIKGWKEIEYEVMRDGNGDCITVCNMENVDPVGVHTGDSIVVAPSQTLSDKEYQLLRTASIEIINAIEVKGGCNVQIALHPHRLEYAIIEINPRVSRSSALASKATGYSWNDAKECMTVNTSSGIFEMEQMESLIYKGKQSTLMGVPVEKVFQRKRVDVHLFDRNNFVPTIHNNQIVTQGYFDTIKGFVDAVEKRKRSSEQSLEAIIDTYKLIESIRSIQN